MADVWFVVLIVSLIVFGGSVIICGARGLMQIVSLINYIGRDDDDEEEEGAPQRTDPLESSSEPQ